MSSQNPVFIPGPTNIPERCATPGRADHRPPLGELRPIFMPLFAGVKTV